MAYIREIITDGHPTLRKVAKKVDTKEIADPLFQQLIDDMFATMYAAPGVGLAAPQVNVSKRLFVMDVQDDDREPAVVINPKFELMEEEAEMTEGCLSVPGYVGEITRFRRVAVSGLDRDGNKIRLEGDGLFAQCLQHEIDHLNGVLYIDKAKNIRKPENEEEEQIADAAAAEKKAAEEAARRQAEADKPKPGEPKADEPMRVAAATLNAEERATFVKRVQEVLKQSKCYSGAINGRVDETQEGLNRFLANRKGKDAPARIELAKPEPDYNIVKDGFLQGRNHPADIDPMITLFRRFRHFGPVEQTVPRTRFLLDECAHPGARRDVRDGNARLHLRFRRSGDGEEAGLALNEQVVGLSVAIRAVGSVAGDVAHDQARIGRP